MDKIIDILDPDWIGGLLSIIVSLYVFLLGIPTLFFQTFLPEDIRSLYSRYDKTGGGMAKIGRLEVWILAAILIFGNHGVRFLLSSIDDAFLIKPVIIILYYGISLSFLIWFTSTACAFFRDIIALKINSRRDVVTNIVNTAKQQYDTHGEIDKKLMADLTEISIIYRSAPNRDILFSGLHSLVGHIVDHQQRPYDGGRLEHVLQATFIDCILNDADFCVERNFNTVLKICRHISDRLTDSMTSYDQAKLAIILKRLAGLALSHRYTNVYLKCVKLLSEYAEANFDIYLLNKQAFAQEVYHVVTNEIVRLTKTVVNHTIEERELEMQGLLAYLSWYYDKDGSMRAFSGRVIKMLKSADKLLLDSIQNAIHEYASISEFGTADAITRCFLKKNPTNG